jgi:hypothetical protein
VLRKVLPGVWRPRSLRRPRDVAAEVLCNCVAVKNVLPFVGSTEHGIMQT